MNIRTINKYSRYGGHIMENPDSYPELKSDYGPSLLEYMECPWNSTNIDQCTTRHWTNSGYEIGCDMHRNDAGLKCRDEPFPGKILHKFLKL